MNMLDNSRSRRMNKSFVYNKTNNNSGHVDAGLNTDRLLENQ